MRPGWAAGTGMPGVTGLLVIWFGAPVPLEVVLAGYGSSKSGLSAQRSPQSGQAVVSVPDMSSSSDPMKAS